MATPKRFTNGVTNAAQGGTLAAFPLPDPTSVHVYFDDFDEYDGTATVGNWVATIDTGGTITSPDTDGGALLFTTDTTDDDDIIIQSQEESFTLVAGKKLWFKCKYTASEATQLEWVAGLSVTNTNIIGSASANGVYFRKDDGDTNIDFTVRSGSAALLDDTGVGTASTNATTLGFYWDGVETLSYYVDESLVGTTTVAMPSTEMSVTLAMRNGAAASETISWDYVLAAKAR